MKELVSCSTDETREYARQFAVTLQPGDIVALIGGLGAGKTEFVRGICDVFNCTATVTSPSFTILNIYEGSLRGKPVELYHFDLYRLESPKELENIGYEEYLYGNGISIIEWADRFPDAVPKRAKRIQLEICSDHERRILIENMPASFIVR
ncbi:MAG: tRNA (adenosine(37)-N6)-threonylcarbamoyltransferase complex ATPase subunit type 1 TsaE [Chlorobiales bacterium]|jgi:tRNA threonylcarbamoyladenosine biosynthesis protein TsaE|nr:tRNA (adenosine(37)-N6)-threonylcarbamoyltransferase complex ATPase subunit type 1 TsaE [Chlorobiales bacterium]